jgi:hypothetical protein
VHFFKRLHRLWWAAGPWSLPCGRASVTRPVIVNRIALWILLWFGVFTISAEGRWAVSLLEAATFLCCAIYALRANPHWSVWCLAGVAAWGVLQIALHQTVSPADTESAILYWLAAACWVALGTEIRDRDSFLDGLLWFGAAMSVLELAQLYTSHGRILWFIPTLENNQIFGTFPNHNHYAAFIELLFPLALWRSFRDTARGWMFASVGALMYGSVIASASRAGSILVTLELAAVLAFRAHRSRGRWRVILVLSGVTAFALAAGPDMVWQRLLAPDPYAVRREYLESAMAMFRARPLAGFGLGTWTSAYPAHAVADFGVIANHAHSEWGQWAAEGGMGVATVMAALFVLALRKSFRTVWAIGLAAVMLHAAVDYPLVRLGLGCWWFVLLGVTIRDDKWTFQPQ